MLTFSSMCLHYYLWQQETYFSARKAQKKLDQVNSTTDYLLRVTDEVTRSTTHRWWPSLWRASSSNSPASAAPPAPVARRSHTGAAGTVTSTRFSYVPQVIRRTFGAAQTESTTNARNIKTNHSGGNDNSLLLSDAEIRDRAAAVAQAQSDADDAFRLERFDRAVSLYTRAIELDKGTYAGKSNVLEIVSIIHTRATVQTRTGRIIMSLTSKLQCAPNSVSKESKFSRSCTSLSHVSGRARQTNHHVLWVSN
jgi:hypothetical protein